MYRHFMKLREEHIITEVQMKYADIRKPLDSWVTVMKNNNFQNLQEIKNVFRDTDVVGYCLVFNIKGNSYRLIAEVIFPAHIIIIKNVLTHAEDDKDKWKKGCL